MTTGIRHQAEVHQAGRAKAVPQANLVTVADDTWVNAALPADTRLVDLLLNHAAYIVPAQSATDPAENGVPYQPNLNLRLPCGGCTHIHLKRVGANNATMQWNAFV